MRKGDIAFSILNIQLLQRKNNTPKKAMQAHRFFCVLHLQQFLLQVFGIQTVKFGDNESAVFADENVVEPDFTTSEFGSLA